MNIADVLAEKGRQVVTVRPQKQVADIPRLFLERSIASAVVTDGFNRLMGIVTDREIIKALSRYGAAGLGLEAQDIMVRPAPSCHPRDGVAATLGHMTRERVRHMVVLENDVLIGLVSIGDLVKFRLEDADMESRVLRDLALGHMAAG